MARHGVDSPIHRIGKARLKLNVLATIAVLANALTKADDALHHPIVAIAIVSQIGAMFHERIEQSIDIPQRQILISIALLAQRGERQVDAAKVCQVCAEQASRSHSFSAMSVQGTVDALNKLRARKLVKSRRGRMWIRPPDELWELAEKIILI